MVIPLHGQVTGSTQLLCSCVFSLSNPNQAVNPEWDYAAAKISWIWRCLLGYSLRQTRTLQEWGRSPAKTNDVLAAAGLTGEEHMDIPGRGRALRDVSTAAADQQKITWTTWVCSGRVQSVPKFLGFLARGVSPHVTFRALFLAEHPCHSRVPQTEGQLFAVLTPACHKLQQESREPWKSLTLIFSQLD